MEVSGGDGSLGNLARALTNTEEEEEEEEEEEVSYEEGTQCWMTFIRAAGEGRRAGRAGRAGREVASAGTGRRLAA